jgi:tetratricopeptide (TPR) repeat protein
MTKRRRRKSEQRAVELVHEQGDLLAGVGRPEPADVDAEAVAEELVEVQPGGGAALTEEDVDVQVRDDPVADGGQRVESQVLPVEEVSVREAVEEGGEEVVAEADPEGTPGTKAQPAAPSRIVDPEMGIMAIPEAPRRSVMFELVAEEPPEASRGLPAGERLARAKELVQGGRVVEAVVLYRAILAENPASLKARNNLGALYGATGQHSLALEQFETAAKIDPDNVEVSNNLGATLGALGRYDEAEVELRRALRMDPENVEVHASLGILHFRRGLYTQAEMDLRRVCEQRPEHAQAFFYRGEALNRLGRVDEALEALERAAALQPDNAKAFYTMGILYDRKHLTEEATAMYRRVRELQRG